MMLSESLRTKAVPSSFSSFKSTWVSCGRLGRLGGLWLGRLWLGVLGGFWVRWVLVGWVVLIYWWVVAGGFGVLMGGMVWLVLGEVEGMNKVSKTKMMGYVLWKIS